MRALLGLALTVLAATAWAADTRAETSTPPNIVLILSDDMGYSDIGCYGSEIATPQLDALARGGVRFTQFYNTARCCPTRASLLTGLYPHQAGMGHMTGAGHRVGDGYAGNLNARCVTIAEALRPAGYATLMCGKWHVANNVQADGPKHTWPLQRGFDRFYGTIQGGGSFYDPTTLCRGNRFITPENDPEYHPAKFYYTDAIGDNAVSFLQSHEKDHPGRPFFLYVAFTAAHWPMHALPEDIAKYRGRYDQGYEPVRQARLARLRQLGLVDAAWPLAPPSGDWAAVADQAWETRCMEVYAAMVDRMDQNIGKIVAQLRDTGRLENTLVLFLQDNGGCAEPMGRTSNAKQVATAAYRPFGPDDLQPQIWPPMQTRDGRPVRQGPGIMPGPEDTYIAYGRDWAHVSNTPFREYKHWVHEGGIATPLIAHWPAGIRQTDRLIAEPSHLIDIMATCLDAAGAPYPADKTPLPGRSLLPIMTNSSAASPARLLYWEHEGNRAVRDGRWKLVAKGAAGPWELYDMRADRTEANDVAGREPEQVSRLSAAWEQWAVQAGVKPWPWKAK